MRKPAPTRLLTVLALVVAMPLVASAQRFLLVTPEAPSVRSYATLTSKQLTIQNRGRTFRYLRRPLLDSPDGRYLGYHALGTGRRLRWPVTNHGQMMINDSIRNRWRLSQMTISPLPGTPVVPTITRPVPLFPNSYTMPGYGSVFFVQPPPPTHTVRYVANRPLPPALVHFKNRHNEDLLVGLIDRRNPNQRAQEILIKAGQSVRVPIERDPGGMMVSSLVAHDGRVLQVLDRIPVPGKTIYDAAVYEYKVVSKYYDRTRPGLPATQLVSQRKGTRSLALFSIPAGQRMMTGTILDVFKEAQLAGNPGAVRLVPQLKGFTR